MNVDDGLEDIRWIRGLGGERLPAASYALLSNLKKGQFCAIGEGPRFVCGLLATHQRPNVFVSVPGRRPPRITCRDVNTVARGWVGAPNERTPGRFNDAVVPFADRCLSRTRNLGASNYHDFFSGRSWLNIWPGIIFFVSF